MVCGRRWCIFRARLCISCFVGLGGWFAKRGQGGRAGRRIYFWTARLGWVGLGCSYISKSADDRILEQKTEMLFGHWREGGEERRGEVRVGEGWGVGFSVS